jgi:hypothetical protein
LGEGTVFTLIPYHFPLTDTGSIGYILPYLS